MRTTPKATSSRSRRPSAKSPATSPTRRHDNVYYIEVVGKALAVLDAFGQAGKPRLTLAEVAAGAGLNKNTAFRILHTLAQHGYIHKDGRQYELGVRLAELGESRLPRKDVVALAGPHLDALRDRFGETVNLGVLDGAKIRYVDVRESPHRFRLAERIGAGDYLHSTALGKCWLAFSPFEEVRRLVRRGGLPRLTPNTITTLARLQAELAEIRARGYALDREESMPGAFCIGVPVLDGAGKPVAAISISGPRARFGESRARSASQALRKAAAAIQDKLRS